jgi:hypothetical protein
MWRIEAVIVSRYAKSPSLEGVIVEIRDFLERPDTVHDGVRHSRNVDPFCTGRWEAYWTSDWMVQCLAERRPFRAGKRIQRIKKARLASTIEGNDELPALRRYYSFRVRKMGAWVIETRQLTEEERKIAVWQACRILEKEGIFKLLKRKDGEFLAKLTKSWQNVPDSSEVEPPLPDDDEWED